MTKVDDATVVIERPDRSVEKVSRSRVVLAPTPTTEEEMKEILKPTMAKDKEDDYPTKKVTNLKGMVDVDGNEVNKEKRTRTQDENELIPNERNDETEKEDEHPTEEFVIHKIIDHKINRSRRHRYAKAGEPLYRVRWYGFNEEYDTWEPTKHLPRSKIVSYHNAKKQPLPTNIDQADDG